MNVVVGIRINIFKKSECKLPLGKLNIWEVGTWMNTQKVAAWEKAIGKVLTILKCM